MPARTLTRRGFLIGCTAAIAGMAGARLTRMAFADPTSPASANDEILIVIFLRGGWDTLNVVPPIHGDDRAYYEAARTTLKVPASGVGAAIPLNGQFGLHPSMAPLHGLYQSGQLAIVHAVGLTSDTRSHFDAMQFMELGTPGVKTTTTGWITRHLQSAPTLPDPILLPALSAGSAQATSLLSFPDAVALSSPSSFRFAGNSKYREWQRQALRSMYTGSTWLHQAAARTLDVATAIEAANPSTYTPANGAIYPSESLGDSLQVVAQMIKLDFGLRAATIDMGGWDTHEHQGVSPGSYMPKLLDTLARGMAAFYTDLDGCGAGAHTRRLTIVVMSEFGRRLRENANGGTDHGHGSVMLALGGSVNGGQIYGTWPGLHADQLYDHADLDVTTDYRRVLSDILTRRLGNPNLDFVFPGYTGYQPMGIVRETPPPTPPPDLPYRIFLPTVSRC
ncbi:MAG TPA: DUF1501 domain-containing protein [Anaerolineae bacterium]|nr:DUF1501 domain-containing protein [Anaerolineae bacterium]